MAPRRRPVNLTIAEKYDILLMNDTGESGQTIIEKYGISRPVFYGILEYREDIKRQYESSTIGFSCSTNRITMRRTANIDEVVYQWYLRCKEGNVQMSRADIQNKAVEINEKLNGNPGFRAHAGWLQGFQERYHISTTDITEDVPTVTISVLEAFAASFNRTLQVSGLALKNVYNVVCTTLVWKGVPERTTILSYAKLTGSLKMYENYVTVLFCANATGCHKLPVLIIGNIPESESLYNFNTEAFSTIYRSKTDVCMDSTIFTQWYKEHFLESVKRRQIWDNGCWEKTLLLLDNATSLYDLDDLNKIDPLVRVISPPLDVSLSIQPMNCGIIIGFKRKYRKRFLETITPLLIYNTEEDVMEIHKKLSMWDCCRIVCDAWSCVDDAILIHSWDDILQRKIMRRKEYVEKWKADASKTLELLHSLPGCELSEETDLLNWYNIDDGHNIIKKICTDEVLEKFIQNNLDERLNIDIFDYLGGLL